MFIRRSGNVSERCQEDYSDILEGMYTYELKLASILHEFDVSKWYYDADYIVPCKIITTLDEYLTTSDKEYVFVRHDSVSAKDVLDITVFERTKEGYDYMLYIASRSPRVQEAIRLNTLLYEHMSKNIKDMYNGNVVYTSRWIVRDIIPIDAEYRVLIIDGITKWIIPDYIERDDEHHELIKEVVKKFKVRYPRDNYAIDVVISDGKALILELNPLLHGILDVSPYENMINLKELDGHGNVRAI